MFSLKDVVDACLIPEGTYTLQTLVPPNVPEHRIEFRVENGVLKGYAETEHGRQTVTGLRIHGRQLSWTMLGGTPGTEVFRYDMRMYNEGYMLGHTYRIDVPEEEAAESPVLGKRMDSAPGA